MSEQKKFSVVSLKANDKATYDLSFWSSSWMIQSYCETILADCGIPSRVIVKLGVDEKPKATRPNENLFVIHLPTINPDQPQEKIAEDIMLRSVFMRHELAHVLYTDFSIVKNVKHHFLWNCIEDARIEKLFSKKYSGANDPIREVSKFYFKQTSEKILNPESDPKSAFGLYLLIRSKGFSLDGVPEWYEEAFQKYKHFIDSNAETTIKIANELNDFFDQHSNIDQSHKPEMTPQSPQKPLFDDKLEKGKAQPQPQKQKSNHSNNPGESDDSRGDDGGDSENDSNTGESDDNEMFSGDEFSDPASDSSEESGEGKSKVSDEDMISEFLSKAMTNKSTRQESKSAEKTAEAQKKISDILKEMKDLVDNSQDIVSEKNDDNHTKIDEKLNELAEKSMQLAKVSEENIKQAEQDIKKTSDQLLSSEKPAVVLPLDDLLRIPGVSMFGSTHPNIPGDKPVFGRSGRRLKRSRSNKLHTAVANSKTEAEKTKKISRLDDDFFAYATIVNNNISVINDAVAYLKQKFQAQTKPKKIFNKEEGLIDTYSLSKLFSGDSRIFMKTFNGVKPDSTVVLLMDFSQSMASSYAQVMTSAIVFNEILDRLKIKREIYFFTGVGRDVVNIHCGANDENKVRSIVQSVDSRSKVQLQLIASGLRTLEVVRDDIVISSSSGGTHRMDFNALMIRARAVNEKDSRHTQRVLGSMVSQKIRYSQAMGSTPEPQCVLKIQKQFANYKNKHLIVVNDGQYNGCSEEIAKLMSFRTKELIQKTTDAKDVADTTLIGVIFEKLKRYGKASFDVSDAALVDRVILTFCESLSKSIERNLNSAEHMAMSTARDNSKKLGGNKALERDRKNIRKEISTIKKDMDELKKQNIDIAARWGFVIDRSGASVSITIDENRNADYVGSTFPMVYKTSFLTANSIKLSLSYWSVFETFDSVKGMSKYLEISMRNLDKQYNSDNVGMNRHYYNVMYREFIDNMRRNGWYVCGFGIKSEDGKSYIGDNFAVLDSMDDIKVNFSRKLREII